MTLVQWSPMFTEGKLWKKKSSVLSGINGSKRARMSKSQMKTMLITFFDIKYIVPFEFILQGKRVNQVYYM